MAVKIKQRWESSSGRQRNGISPHSRQPWKLYCLGLNVHVSFYKLCTLWAVSRWANKPSSPRVCMYAHICHRCVYLAPTEVIKSAVIDHSAPLPHLHAHPRDASLNLWPSVCEPLRLGSSLSTYVFMACVFPSRIRGGLVRCSVFLHFGVYATDPPLHDLIIICLCYSASILHLHSRAVILTWRLMMIIVVHHWTTMRFNLQTLSLTSTKVSDELFIFVLVTLICFCCVVVLHCYAITMLDWHWICGSEQCSIIIIL